MLPAGVLVLRLQLCTGHVQALLRFLSVALISTITCVLTAEVLMVHAAVHASWMDGNPLAPYYWIYLELATNQCQKVLVLVCTARGLKTQLILCG